jgi:hypothetical protein
MKTDHQDNSRAKERRRWLGAIVTGLAGVTAWTLGKREKSPPPVSLAAVPPAGADTSLRNSRILGARKLAVRPAAGAVKRHG